MSSRTFNQSAVVLLTAIMLQACGGGGGDSSSSLTGNTVSTPSAESCQTPQAFDSTSSTCVTPALRGQFVDKPVAGLYYETGSGIQGYTDATGSFGYSTANEQVKFSVGKKVDIGYAQAAHVVHVYDLEATQDERLSGVNVRRAQVLQSLDANLGKAEVIKLPAGIDQKLPANYVLKYDATQTEFDASLKGLLSQADLVAQFVGADAAKASADSYIVKSVDSCPLKTPSAPQGIKVGILTCMDIARINYYNSNIVANLNNAIASGLHQGDTVDASFNKDAAEASIDNNVVINSLETVDSFVDLLESKYKKEVAKSFLSGSNVIVKTAKTIVDYNVTFSKSGDTSAEEQLKRHNQYFDLVSAVSETLSSNIDCVSGEDKITGCAKSIQNVFDGAKKLKDAGESIPKDITWLPNSDMGNENGSTAIETKKQLEIAFKVIKDSTGIASKAFKLGGAIAQEKSKNDVIKTVFGVANATIKTVADTTAYAYAQHNGNESAVEWQQTTGILLDAADTISSLGESCWGSDGEVKAADKWKCLSDGAKSLIKFGTKRSFELIGGAGGVIVAGRVNEAVVTKQIIEEFLFAGEAGEAGVFESHNVHLYRSFSSFSLANLSKAISAERGLLDGSYWSLIDAVRAGRENTTVIESLKAAKQADFWLHYIYAQTHPNFNSPNIDMVLTPQIQGSIKVSAQFDRAGSNLIKGSLLCLAEGSNNFGSQSPASSDDNIISFEAFYKEGGEKVIICSVYTTSGVFAGSKALSVNLSPSPKVQTARSTAPTILTTTVALGETVVGWLGNIATQIASILWEVFDALGHSIYSALSTVNEAVSITFDITGDKTIQATYRDASDSTLGQTNTTVTVGAGMAINNITYSPTLQLNQPSTITVTGTDFPETVLLALTNAECGAPFDYYHIEAGTGFSQICTPRTSGEQTLTVKRATGVNAGSVARNANVTNAVLNSITLPDTRNASDFIKLDESGNELSSDASSWACTKDKLTGLIWEIKTKDGSIQDSRGLTSSYGIPSLLDSLNGKKWCGLSNWRMPEQKDLYTLTNFDGTDNEGMFHVENTLFPDWVNTSYYTGYPYGGNSYSYPSMHQFYPKSGMTGTNGSWEGCCYPMQGRMVAGKSVLSADRFEYSPDGSYVYDALLDLTWQRCPIGSKFNNNYCEDTATVMTFEQVKNTLVDNWRLPNAKELVTYGAASYNGTWSSSIFDSSKNLNVVIYGSGDVGYLDTANTQSRATAYLLKSGKQFIGSRYIKISNAGASLPPNAVLGPDSNSWACTKDSQTGLTWEVKTDDGGLRDKDWAYSWYDPNPSTNGGNSGFQNIGYCQGSSCDTASYIAALNPTKLCGYSDWRMPRINELSLLMYNSSSTNSVNQAYFPNSISNIYVSATPSMEDSDFVWIADGNNNGYSHYLRKDYSNYVRAVRSNNP